MMALTNHNTGIPLRELLQGIVDTEFTHLITGVSLDSRLVKAGDLFLAYQGENDSGVCYIKDAINAGAAAIAIDAAQFSEVSDELSSFTIPIVPVGNLRYCTGRIVECFYDYPSSDLQVVGVTGTNGKTSVAYILAKALSAYQEKEVGFLGTLGYGLINSLSETVNTTPDPVTIHTLFDELRSKSVRSVMMEVSSHALEQDRVSGVDFDIGVFTNLSRDHLDYHGDMHSYAQAKRRLFSSTNMKFAVINTDDEYGKQLYSELKSDLCAIPYCIVEEFIDDVISVQAIVNENVLRIRSPWGRDVLKTQLDGRFNAYNLLASLAVLCLLDVPFEQAIQKLEKAGNAPGRLEYFGHENSPRIFVDYAHTPDALKQVLLSLREQETGRLLCIFGCGGERDQGKRPDMGTVAEQHADKVIITSDNPRNEDPQIIINDILSGIERPELVDVQADRTEAIRSTIQSASNTDIILIAGKGHETYQEISGKRFPFSDRQLVRNVLEEQA